MAGEDSELVGGISVELGASHSRLPGDLAAAEKLVQDWAKQTATVQLRAAPAGAGASGGGGGQARAVRRQAAVEDDTYQRNLETRRIQYVDQIEKQRRQSRESGGASPIEVNRSEQSLFRQRQAEELRGVRARQKEERANQALLIADKKQADQRSLIELSYEAQRESQEARENSPTGTFAGRARSTSEQKKFIEQEQARANALSSQVKPKPVVIPTKLTAPPADDIERARQRALIELENTPGGRGTGRPGYRQDEVENDRQRQEQVARAEAQRLGQARTPRTAAAGLGGFGLFGGPTRQVIEAQAEQAAANREVARTQAQLNKPAVIRDAVAFRKASEEATGALTRQAKATEVVESLATKGTALRSLAAVTVAGAAFGLAMQGVSVALGLVEKGLGPTLERLTGFASTTAAYTDSLSDATRAASGNAQAVTALKLASTGMSSVTAASIQPLIQQRAEIEAGNKAIQDQIEAFHVAENLRKQGGTAGLGGGTGGFLGTGLLGTPGTGEQIGNLFQQLRDQANTANVAVNEAGQGRRTTNVLPQQAAAGAADAGAAFARGLAYVNEQMVKGGDAAAQLKQGTQANNAQIEQTARAFDGLSPAMAAAIRANYLYSDSIKDVEAAARALSAINIAGTLPDPALLAEQFNRQNPVLAASAERQARYAREVQLPAQFALQNLQNPLKPIGTGYQARDAQEQRRIQGDQQKSIDLQKELNATYEQGAQILQTQYHIPPQLLNDLKATGQAISNLQAQISNEQAAYQVAQYNYQLFIAKRTLADIGGLTGKNFGAGQSYLGQLEKENLALSRQGQLLQFSLSQRQLNFQVAQAGFQAPGETPEQIAANVKEAQYEASIAQKQLNIQKQMFGNQVQIVDIQNLREGATLVKQIALLEQGRKVTIDVQVKTEEIDRLLAKQQQELAQIGTYVSKVDSLAAAAMGEIQQLELAAGHAIGSVADTILSQFGLALQGMSDQLDVYFGGSTGAPGQSGAGGGPGGESSRTSPKPHKAAGGVGRTTGPTDMTIGEAGGEEYAILAHPRAYMGAMGGGGATVNFYGGISVRSDSDIDTIVRKVEDAVNRRAGLIMRTG